MDCREPLFMRVSRGVVRSTYICAHIEKCLRNKQFSCFFSGILEFSGGISEGTVRA